MPEDKCPINITQCDEIKRIKVLWNENEKWKSNIEERVETNEESIKDIKVFQGETKAYVVEIKDQLNRLEQRLFVFMGDLVKNLTSNEVKTNESSVKERAHNQKEWVSLIKYVLGGTIIAIVAYLFGNK